MVGSLVELVIKAYGAGAAASVAISDAETLRGKVDDALAAVPNLSEEYRDAQYVVEHREEIRSAIDYLNVHTPPQSELKQAADEGSETLRGIETTYSEVLQAKDAVDDFTPRPDEAFGHLKGAWEAKPDLDSIRQLAEIAEQVSPLADEVEVLAPVYYGGFVAVTDNFASDEIVATFSVMVMALALAFVLGQAVGFWIRRGRPGLVARWLQRSGARTFRRWYVRNLPYALSPPLYAAARERIQRDIVADPQGALDPEALRELESYFVSRSKDDVAR
jgi:hypothetical protein